MSTVLELSVTVTIYVKVPAVDGIKIGFAIEASLKSFVGNQLKVYGELPPTAVGEPPKIGDSYWQTVLSAPASTVKGIHKIESFTVCVITIAFIVDDVPIEVIVGVNTPGVGADYCKPAN